MSLKEYFDQNSYFGKKSINQPTNIKNIKCFLDEEYSTVIKNLSVVVEQKMENVLEGISRGE